MREREREKLYQRHREGLESELDVCTCVCVCSVGHATVFLVPCYLELCHPWIAGKDVSLQLESHKIIF